MKLKGLSHQKESYDKTRHLIIKQRCYSADKVSYIQSYDFSSRNIQMWEFDHKEGWAPKIDVFKLWCWRKFLRVSELHWVKPVNPKGNLPWVLFGRTDVGAGALIIWPSVEKSWLIGKDGDAGENWRQRQSGQQMMRLFDTITYSMHMNLRKLWEIVKDREAWPAVTYGVTKSQM